MYPFVSSSGNYSVCRFACLPRQHEGPLGTAESAGSVLRAGHQGHAQVNRGTPGEAQVCQGLRLPAQQVSTDRSCYRLISWAGKYR